MIIEHELCVVAHKLNMMRYIHDTELNVKRMRVMIDKDMLDVNMSDPTRYGMTPLIHAVMFGHDDIVELLLSKGACVNKTDADLWSPLCWAVFKGRVDATKLLLEYYPRIDYKNNAKRLMIFVRNARLPLVSPGHVTAAALVRNHLAIYNVMNIKSHTPYNKMPEELFKVLLDYLI